MGNTPSGMKKVSICVGIFQHDAVVATPSNKVGSRCGLLRIGRVCGFATVSSTQVPTVLGLALVSRFVLVTERKGLFRTKTLYKVLDSA